MRPWELKPLNQAAWLVCEAVVANIVGVMYGVLAGLHRYGPTEPKQVAAALGDRGVSPAQARLILYGLARAGLITTDGEQVALTPFGEPVAAACDEWIRRSGGRTVLSIRELLRILAEAGRPSGGPHEAGADGGSRA